MSRIFITGDTHGDNSIHKLNTKNFPIQYKLTKEDYVIICGDFGFIWDKKLSHREKYWLDWLYDKPWTTLFVSGNHENIPRLNAMGISNWNGGKIHKINESVFHLMNGQIFNIHAKKFFTMGGANSRDKAWRIEHNKTHKSKVWWKEEIPSKKELDEGVLNLEQHDWKVDYILTHCAPFAIEQNLFSNPKINAITSYLNNISKAVNYTKWYCGHYHLDKMVDDNIRCIYDDIIEI